MRSVLLVAVSAASVLAAEAQGDAVQLARTTVDRLVKGEYAAIVQTFDEKVKALLSEDMLRAAWQSVSAQAGSFLAVSAPQISTKDDFRIVVFPATFERASVNIQVVVNAAGQIAGLNIRPAASTVPFADAPYVDRSAFAERDATVDAGGWPLPASLAIPNGAGPFPAVVLVHGSGPADRDETFGPNKPFRDLAHGLASRGVAVLRYEKRTRQHASKLASLKQFTVREETVDDAVAAVKLLRSSERIDPARVFVLGHSLGGMVAPRIASAAGTEIRGLIILAGAVRSLEQSLIDQTRYLALADGTISPGEQKAIDQLVAFAEKVKTVQPNDPAPTAGLGISAPASYWIDLRGYDPPSSARAVRASMLILQGGRDYQVTPDDFGVWKQALGSRADVTFKLYEPLNHMFIAGEGKSYPGEYNQPGHVSADVITDIASWINGAR
jgi:dienelactone hydrolase